MLHWEATHDMRGLSGWFGAASGVWSTWTVNLLRTALGQEPTMATSRSGRSTPEFSRAAKRRRLE